MAQGQNFKLDGGILIALEAVRKAGGILGELIPRMVWNAIALSCVEVADFIELCEFRSKKYEAENGFEIRCLWFPARIATQV